MTAPATHAPTLLEVKGLQKLFPVTEGILARRVVGEVRAVDSVDFTLRRGETLGLVGESGCGKTTTGRCILLLERPTAGEILYDGVDLAKLKHKQLRALRRRIQVIFQDPYSSLNPRMKVGDIIAEPMKVHAIEPDAARRAARVRELLAICGLSPNFVDRYPHEMSGGQRQRVGIARALALNPEFIICDEAVSALDVSIQAQIVNLLEDLRERFGLTYLFIAHDLSVVRHLCHRVAVMYLGRIVELADCDAAVRQRAPSLHAGAARCGAGAGSERRSRPQVPTREGGGAEPDQPAAGLRVSSALPDRGRKLQPGPSGAARGASRPLGGLQ